MKIICPDWEITKLLSLCHAQLHIHVQICKLQLILSIAPNFSFPS